MESKGPQVFFFVPHLFFPWSFQGLVVTERYFECHGLKARNVSWWIWFFWVVGFEDLRKEPGEQRRNHIIYLSIYLSVYLSQMFHGFFYLHDFGDFHGQHEHGEMAVKTLPSHLRIVLMVGFVEMISAWILPIWHNLTPFFRGFWATKWLLDIDP